MPESKACFILYICNKVVPVFRALPHDGIADPVGAAVVTPVPCPANEAGGAELNPILP